MATEESIRAKFRPGRSGARVLLVLAVLWGVFATAYGTWLLGNGSEAIGVFNALLGLYICWQAGRMVEWIWTGRL